MRKREMAGRVGTGLAIGAGLFVLYRLLAGEGETGEDATYPPLDVPKPIAEDLWIVDSGPMRAMALVLPIRMTVIRLAGGDLLLHSPTRYSPELAQALSALGRVRHLVAPNIAHWTFLAEWQRAFPDATTWAAPGLRERAQVRASDVRIDRELDETAPPEWAGEVEQGVIAGGGGFCELWFLHARSRTLLLVDTVQNLEPAKLPAVTRTLMRAAAATRGTTPLYLRPALRLGGSETGAAIRSVVALKPERVIFTHGRYFGDNGAESLARAFSWLV